MDTSVGWRSPQERLEGTRLGRVVISAFLVLTLFSVISANLYPSDLKRQFFRVAKPWVYVTGLDQGWDVFAPDPRRQTLELQAQIFYSDGSVEIWKLPGGDSLFGAYWDYRWRKWVEMMLGGFAPGELLPPAAQWIARQQTDPKRKPVEIQLVRRAQDLRPPGVKPTHGPWTGKVYYTLTIKNGRGP